MFSITFDEGGDLLQKIVDIIKDHIHEGTITVTESGLGIQHMDSCHISLTDIWIDQGAATHYNATDEHKLGINFKSLNSILKYASKSGTCTLFQKKPLDDILTITFAGEKDAVFELKLLNLDYESISIPEFIEHKSVQEVSANDLTKILKQSSEFSESVIITKKSHDLEFVTHGDGANSCLKLHTNSISSSLISGEFSIKYLLWFCKASILSQTVQLALGDEANTMLLQFEKCDYRIKFFLAGKITT